MYKLLIVDDEFLVIDGLKKLVDWKQYGIKLIGEASNGNEGISLVQEKNPDIIISDVKMPGMDGLDMIKRIKDINSNVKILVFSGYDDYNWVKRAFNYGVADYILKPLDLSQLDFILKKVIQDIEVERAHDQEEKKIKKLLNKSMEVLKKEALTDLFTGQYDSIAYVEEKLSYLNMVLDVRPFTVLLFKTRELEGRTDEGNSNILSQEILSDILSYLENEGFGYGSILGNDRAAFILNAPDTDLRWSLILAEYLYLKFMSDKFKIIFGIGGIHDQLNRVKIAYIEAEQAIQYNYLVEKDVTCYDDIRSERIKLGKVDYPHQLEKIIIEGLKLTQREMTFNALNSYFEQVQQKKFEIVYFKNIITELLFLIKKELNSTNIDLSKIFIDEYEEIYSVQKANTLEDIRKMVFRFTEKVMNYVETTSSKSNKQVVHEVMQYIESNYSSKDISLQDIAERVYLTPNYISSLTKQETGYNFSDIVVKKRMELAKELLSDVTLRTYEISERVGYSDPNYFTRTFKKLVGMSPSEFRDKFCK